MLLPGHYKMKNAGEALIASLFYHPVKMRMTRAIAKKPCQASYEHTR